MTVVDCLQILNCLTIPANGDASAQEKRAWRKDSDILDFETEAEAALAEAELAESELSVGQHNVEKSNEVVAQHSTEQNNDDDEDVVTEIPSLDQYPPANSPPYHGNYDKLLALSNANSSHSRRNRHSDNFDRIKRGRAISPHPRPSIKLSDAQSGIERPRVEYYSLSSANGDSMLPDIDAGGGVYDRPRTAPQVFTGPTHLSNSCTTSTDQYYSYERHTQRQEREMSPNQWAIGRADSAPLSRDESQRYSYNKHKTNTHNDKNKLRLFVEIEQPPRHSGGDNDPSSRPLSMPKFKHKVRYE